MKIKILFVIKDLGCGGAEKSLISLLSRLNYDKYDVDLLRLGNDNFFINSIPENVNLIEVNPITESLLSKPAKTVLLDALKQRKFPLFFIEFISQLAFRFFSKLTSKNAKVVKWKLSSILIKNLKFKYDVAIGYNYDYPLYYIVDKVNAKKKIGWVHGNYLMTKSIPSIDKFYYSKLNNIVTVSSTCKNVIQKVFPAYENKIKVIENIVSRHLIHKMSNESIDKSFIETKEKTREIKIVTVARLSHEKGIDLAINSCQKIINDGYNVKWYVVGDGPERLKFQNLINDSGLEKKIVLLGKKDNPYIYMNKADIYVQPSRTEGKAIAIEEAKILNLPIVVTNFSTVSDQIENLINGIIVPITIEGIYDGILSLINSSKLRNSLIENLKSDISSNENEVNKLYELVN